VVKIKDLIKFKVKVEGSNLIKLKYLCQFSYKLKISPQGSKRRAKPAEGKPNRLAISQVECGVVGPGYFLTLRPEVGWNAPP